MRASARVALVSLTIATGGLTGCGSFDKQSDTASQGLVSSEYPTERMTSAEERSEFSAKEEGASGTQTADTPSEKKDKPAQKAQRPGDGQGYQEASGTRARRGGAAANARAEIGTCSG